MVEKKIIVKDEWYPVFVMKNYKKTLDPDSVIHFTKEERKIIRMGFRYFKAGQMILGKKLYRTKKE